MFYFKDIAERIKIELGFKTDKELYDFLGVEQGVYSNWKRRNKIPYETITSLCFEKNLNLKYILSGDSKYLKTQNEINYKEEINNLCKKLNKKELEEIYYILKLKTIEKK